MDHDYYLGALIYHLEPYCTSVEMHCTRCGGKLELVPPEKLYFECPACYPQET